MFLRIASRLTYANVIATLALFVALGGGAYAAATLPKNSVGTAQLQKGAVTPPKLAKSTRASLKGKTGARGAQGLQGPAGAAGAPGPQGSTGAQGTAGAAGATGLQGTSGAKGATGVQGATGPAGNPATADGPAVEFGNVHGPGTGFCILGLPSGLSTTPNCDAVSAAPFSSPLPADATLRDFTATIPSALASAATAGVFETTSGIFQLACTIATGQTSCSAAGPSATIAAGTSLNAGISGAAASTVTSLHFSYRLGTPGTAPAPTAPASPRTSIYRGG